MGGGTVCIFREVRGAETRRRPLRAQEPAVFTVRVGAHLGVSEIPTHHFVSGEHTQNHNPLRYSQSVRINVVKASPRKWNRLRRTIGGFH
jgi:hypothetical protein